MRRDGRGYRDGRGPVRRRRGRAWVRALPALVAGALAGACGTAPEEVMTWQEFVDVYVGLRTAELRSPDAVITEARRDSVLVAHGVTEDDLLAFAERYGENVTFMEGVWSAVENRMVELSSRPDSVG